MGKFDWVSRVSFNTMCNFRAVEAASDFCFGANETMNITGTDHKGNKINLKNVVINDIEGNAWKYFNVRYTDEKGNKGVIGVDLEDLDIKFNLHFHKNK